MAGKVTLLKFAKKHYREKSEPDSNAVEFLKDHKPGRLLDIGCGIGLEASYAAGLGHEVTALDSDYDLIKIAKSRDDRVQFRYVEFFSFAKTTGKDHFDTVIDNGFSHCLRKSRVDKYYHELAKILKHNGMAYIKVYSDKDEYCRQHCPQRKWTPVEGFYYYFYSKAELESLVKRHGFEIVKSQQLEEAGHTWLIMHARLKSTKL